MCTTWNIGSSLDKFIRSWCAVRSSSVMTWMMGVVKLEFMESLWRYFKKGYVLYIFEFWYHEYLYTKRKYKFSYNCFSTLNDICAVYGNVVPSILWHLSLCIRTGWEYFSFTCIVYVLLRKWRYFFRCFPCDYLWR